MTEESNDFKLTGEHFELFKTEFNYWVDKIGLRSWEFWFVFKEDDKNRAWFSANVEGRLAEIGLNTVFKDSCRDDAKADICKSAFHEAAEILFCNLAGFANMDAPPSMKSEIITEVHRIIRRLEHLMWRPDWERRQK